MSKIEELIAELCPEGVELICLSKLATKIKTGKLNANAMVVNGEYPFFTCDAKPFRIDKYYFDTEAILISGNGSQVGHVNYYRGKFNAYQRTYVLSDFVAEVNIWFIYYYFKNYLRDYIYINSKKGSIPYITLPMLQNFTIPLPPLPVQQEIVNILDKFTSLTAELEAELEARSRQYVYYRDKLLGFENSAVEWKTLGEVGTFVRGNGLQKKDFTETGVGCIHYGQIYTYYGSHATKTKSFVSENLAKKLKKASKNDLVIAGVSENVVDVCKAVVWLGEDDICISGDAFIYKHNQNPKFVGYLLQTNRFLEFKKQYAQGAKVTRLQSGSLPKYKIPIPPREEQDRIVAILDKFDALVTDISTGLPAEIKARKQQYEHYRGKLLTF